MSASKERQAGVKGHGFRLLLLAAALAVSAGGLASAEAEAQAVVFVVRHAEAVQDGSRDPPLTPAGERRALVLADLLGRAGIDAIYASDLVRTQATAAPLAERLGIPIGIIPQPFEEDAVARLARDHAGERVLVVGHSNTVPELLRLFGDPGVQEIERADHGNLFVVIPDEGGSPTVLHLRMGG